MRTSRFLQLKSFNVNNDPQFSLLTEFLETTEASRERLAEQLFNDLESAMLVTELSNLGASGIRFEPAASCVNDIYAISNKCVASRLMSLWEMHQCTLFGAILAQPIQTPPFSLVRSWLAMEGSDTSSTFTCSSLLTSPDPR